MERVFRNFGRSTRLTALYGHVHNYERPCPIYQELKLHLGKQVKTNLKMWLEWQRPQQPVVENLTRSLLEKSLQSMKENIAICTLTLFVCERELWTRKCHDESEIVNWITVHIKPCLKCHKPVEKDGSCNLVSCICRQAFWKKSGILLFVAI